MCLSAEVFTDRCPETELPVPIQNCLNPAGHCSAWCVHFPDKYLKNLKSFSLADLQVYMWKQVLILLWNNNLPSKIIHIHYTKLQAEISEVWALLTLITTIKSWLRLFSMPMPKCPTLFRHLKNFKLLNKYLKFGSIWYYANYRNFVQISIVCFYSSAKEHKH